MALISKIPCLRGRGALRYRAQSPTALYGWWGCPSSLRSSEIGALEPGGGKRGHSTRRIRKHFRRARNRPGGPIGPSRKGAARCNMAGGSRARMQPVLCATKTEYAMPFLRWFTKKRSNGRCPTPVYFRVRDSAGKLAQKVTVQGTWAPSGKGFASTPLVVDGLFMLPWRAAEKAVNLTIQVADTAHDLVVHRNRPDPNRAIEVELAKT